MTISGMTVLVTGSTGGLGRCLAVRLGTAGARVLVHGRDAGRAEQVRNEIRAVGGPEPDVVLADLADLREVDRLAHEVERRVDRLDVLVNNAGVGFGRPGAPRQVSNDGIELRFAVNYLAGYRLTRQLLPLLVRSAPARIVNVASAGQRALDFADLMLEHTYDGVSAYRQSKLAQIMLTVDLAAELHDRDVTVNALHPATFMDTTMVQDAEIRALSTVEEGAAASLRLIIGAASETLTGCYFNGQRKARANDQAYDTQARRRLRQISDELIAAALPG